MKFKKGHLLQLTIVSDFTEEVYYAIVLHRFPPKYFQFELIVLLNCQIHSLDYDDSEDEWVLNGHYDNLFKVYVENLSVNDK